MRPSTAVDPPCHRRWGLAAAIALLCHLAFFGTDVVVGGFRNLDVAGIAYNARLLLDGELPYVASWEPKPPGAFFLFAAILPFGSMHAVWVVAILWGAATSLAVGSLAARLWGEQRLLLPAVALHAGSVLLPTQADVNYVFWACLPFVLAAAMAFKPAEHVARPRLHWALVGAVAAAAVLFKQSMVGLLLLLPLAVHLRAGAGLAARLRAAAFGVAGAGAVFLALALPWLVAGEARALLVGLGLTGGWWVDYSAAQADVMGGVVRPILRGVGYVGETLQIASAAALLGLVALPTRQSRSAPPRWAFPAAIVFLLASFVGMAVTLRFYLHYLAQILPALVVIALHPAGLLVRLLDRLAGFGARHAVVCLLLATTGMLLRVDKVERLRVSRADFSRIVGQLCATVEPHLGADERVLGWGWQTWGVYEACRRRAPGPIYKAMSLLTTPNTNTGWRKTRTMVFRPGPAAERYVEDFLARPPALFLWSPGYARHGSEPLLEMPAIATALERGYRGVRLERGYVAFLRDDVHDRVRAASGHLDEDAGLEDVLADWDLAAGGIARAEGR